MHTHNCIDSLSNAFLSSALSASSAHYAAKMSERKKSKDRDCRHGGDLLPYQAVHSTPAVRESVILAAAVWCLLALLPVHSVSEGWSDRPPDSRPAAPLAPCLCSADQVLSVPARDFKETGWRQ